MVDVKFIMALETRDTDAWPVPQASDWAMAMGYNGPHHSDDPRFGGNNPTYATPPGPVHTSYTLFDPSTDRAGLPPPELWQKHPEWMWPRNRSVYGQLCWSNASLIEYLTTRVKGYLRAQPAANVISVSQNDNGEYCQSPSELEIINEEKSPAGPLLRAINAIAAAIKDEFPHVAISTLACKIVILSRFACCPSR